MAVTAYTFSNFVHDGYSPYWIRVGSDNSTKLNFSMSFYCRVGHYINPDSDVGVFKSKPNPAGEIFFNPQKVYSSYISSTCYPTITDWTATPDASLIIQVYMGEEFDNTAPGNTPTGVTLYSYSSSTGIHNVVNSYEQPEFGFQLSGLCDVYGIIPFHILQTDWTSANYYPIKRNEWMSMSYYQRFQNSSNEWNILTYDVNSNLLGHYVLPLAGYSSTTWASSYQLPLGTNNLSFSATNISGSSGTIINNSVHFYSVYASHNGLPSVRNSVIYNYAIIDDCDRYEPIRVAWLNHWGGYDYWTFSMKSRTTIERKNNEWERFRDYYWTSGDRTRTNLNIELNKKISITSDWLKQIEADYVSNLFLSPDIFIIKSDGSKIPVQMQDNSSEVKQKDNDRMINYTFNLEYTYGIATQTT